MASRAALRAAHPLHRGRAAFAASAGHARHGRRRRRQVLAQLRRRAPIPRLITRCRGGVRQPGRGAAPSTPSAWGPADKWEVYVAGRPNRDGLSTPCRGRSEAARRGAGEILLTSMDRDGTQGRLRPRPHPRRRRAPCPSPSSPRAGWAPSSTSPRAIIEGEADAVLAASVFHFGTLHDPPGQGVHGGRRASPCGSPPCGRGGAEWRGQRRGAAARAAPMLRASDAGGCPAGPLASCGRRGAAGDGGRRPRRRARARRAFDERGLVVQPWSTMPDAHRRGAHGRLDERRSRSR